MSDITRDDLIEVGRAEVIEGGRRYMTRQKFDRLARESGYMKLHDVIAAMRDLITKEVEFELSAKNLDRPGPDGTHTSEWYVAYGIHTGFNERLHRHLVDWLEAEDV